MREDQLCPFASKCQTSIRRPCLHEDGPPLRRMGGGQRAVGPHLRAIVAHIVNLRQGSEYAAFAIDLERTHLPAVPERDERSADRRVEEEGVSEGVYRCLQI